ncbi:MAG TPA: acyl carrier protein [Dehalococcoidia bacterium]|nr:acyl carrier protein [Dehalococcoidia bacterium]
MSTVNTLRDFIVRELRWNGGPEALTLDYPLIENHVVDSLGLFTLVTFVENQFGIEVGDEELVPENFGTIGAIVSLIERKKASA